MQPPDLDAAALPAIDVIVPVFNESVLIGDKLADLARLDYPLDRLRVWVADGGSTDGTADAVVGSSACVAGLDVRLVHADARGKPAQLSEAFHAATTDWVMVTDCDARLDPGTLRTMVMATRADADVALVGALVEPGRAHPLDRAHWKAVNWLRALEARAGCAGLVVGPAYLARRDLLGPFPEGTIMDDVHLCCRAALFGARIAMVRAPVVELRAPIAVAELARHKFRKTLGYIH
ncbi:MAG: glycosyltransferase, partial [Rhodospirillaceae bacterium]